jgi:PIN domain nuclease of toxin-antitoxin system
MIVVDTHALIWDALTPDRLSATAQRALSDANAGDGLLICDISLWEIAMFIQKGRVQVDVDCQSFINLILQANKTRVQPITPLIAALSVQLPAGINKDPADRLIVATALAENTPLLTADYNLHNTDVIATIW